MGKDRGSNASREESKMGEGMVLNSMRKESKIGKNMIPKSLRKQSKMGNEHAVPIPCGNLLVDEYLAPCDSEIFHTQKRSHKKKK